MVLASLRLTLSCCLQPNWPIGYAKWLRIFPTQPWIQTSNGGLFPEARALLDWALNAGFTADYVLMDSWFTQAPPLRQLSEKGLPVIGMVKEVKQRYLVQGKRMTLSEVFHSLPQSNTKEIKGSVVVQTACGLRGLFFLFADEVRDLNFQTALQQLMNLFLQMSKAKSKKNKTAIFCQLQDWISSLPSYIKGLFGDLSLSSNL